MQYKPEMNGEIDFLVKLLRTVLEVSSEIAERAF